MLYLFLERTCSFLEVLQFEIWKLVYKLFYHNLHMSWVNYSTIYGTMKGFFIGVRNSTFTLDQNLSSSQFTSPPGKLDHNYVLLTTKDLVSEANDCYLSTLPTIQKRCFLRLYLDWIVIVSGSISWEFIISALHRIWFYTGYFDNIIKDSQLLQHFFDSMK